MSIISIDMISNMKRIKSTYCENRIFFSGLPLLHINWKLGGTKELG